MDPLKDDFCTSCMQIRSGYGHQDAIGVVGRCLLDSRPNFSSGCQASRLRNDVVLGAGPAGGSDFADEGTRIRYNLRAFLSVENQMSKAGGIVDNDHRDLEGK